MSWGVRSGCASAMGLGLAAFLFTCPAALADPPANAREYETGLNEDILVPAGTIAMHGLLALGGSIEVTGEASGDAVALCGDVVVNGRVDGDAIAINGHVRISAGGVVTGNAFSLFGGVEQAEGATVHGQVRSLAPVDSGKPGYLDVAFAKPVLVARLLFLLFWFLAALVSAFVAPTVVARGAAELARHPKRLTIIGLLLNLSLLLVTVLAVALIQVFVGIPLLILVCLGWLCLEAAALAAVFHAVGERLAERLHEGGTSGYVQLLAGALAFGLVHFIPVIGELAFAVTLFAGSAAVVATRFGRERTAPLAESES